MLGTVPAFADKLVQDVNATGNNAVTWAGVDVTTTINFQVDASHGGAACELSAATPARYAVNLTNPAPGQTAATVTSDVSSVNFTACGVNYPVTFTVKSLGKKEVSLTRTSGVTLNTGGSAFTITSTAPAANTAPTVTVGGVTATSYEFGAVPAAVCNVTDAEDTSESASPSLSAITGPLASYGLGSQTATCSYTDTGTPALSDSDEVTYTIVDTTDPVLTSPGDRTIEATGPGGAVETFSASATDAVNGVSVECTPASGSTFPLGGTVVTCTATDVSGNTDSASFTVTVEDTGVPSITAPDDITGVEATGPDGAVVTFDDPVVSDLVDTTLTPTCDPVSGSTFALGETEVECTVSDDSGNTSTAWFTIEVVDTTPPAIEDKADVTEEATGPDGAAVIFTKPTASDIVSGATEVICDAESGDTFALGETTVSCSSTDEAGRTGYNSFKVVVVDTTDPVLDAQADITAEATGPGGANVSYDTPGATDLVDTDVLVGCIPSSGVFVALDGSQEVTCTATDDSGNFAQSTFTLLVVDTTTPTLTVPANITASATSAAGATVSYSATATDIVDGDVTPVCTPASGSTFAPGTTTVSCTAADVRGNTSDAQTFTVTVSFAFNGFFAPVDNGGVLNTIKGGQSVPMKWSIPNGSGGFISSLAVVSKVGQVQFTCTATAPTDDIEATSTGGTSLRYDTTANQYIYNWQSPKGAGNCYKVTVHLTDGSAKSALFKTK